MVRITRAICYATTIDDAKLFSRHWQGAPLLIDNQGGISLTKSASAFCSDKTLRETVELLEHLVV